MTNAPSAITGANPLDVKARRRPFGLNAIILIQVLTMLGSGFLLLLFGVGFVFASRMIVVEGIDPAAFQWKLTPMDILQMVLIFVINGVCAFGLWRRQRWAWFLTMLQLGAFMISDLYSYFTNSPAETYAWSMLLNVFMVFYLNQRDVQAIFLTKTEGKQRP
jgi:uncharacterized membrane protein (DUF2068 family)